MAAPESLFNALDDCIHDRFEPFSVAIAGGSAQASTPGIITLQPSEPITGVAPTVISAGVHGNETAPIELVSQLARDLDAGRQTLAVPTLIILGHLPAIAAGQRYLETNLNRLFHRDKAHDGDTVEHRRAVQLMAAVDAFWAEHGTGDDTGAASDTSAVALHLDLHTAIRASHYPFFAVEPLSVPATPDYVWRVLAGAGLQAAVSQYGPSWTFSHYSRHYHHICGFTLELGRVASFGCNDLDALAPMARLLAARVAGVAPTERPADRMQFFETDYEVVRHGPDFELAFADDTPNFTRFEPGQLIARDAGYGETRVEDQPAYVVFPNAKVERGARAALLARAVCPSTTH
ncbi:succinylglutamate desuccinylase [Salinisphaera orenii]|uniref:succinylglutamate desuccinylase n=1 Tax=Salinisphaera orenii TaxID=856731 RepID=UPI000DBE40D0